MKPNLYQKIILGLSGVTASVIGTTILVAPHIFYASYGIELANDPNLLSELRAPGANLAFLGLVMLAGTWRAEGFATARTVALTVFWAFALGRVVGWIVDGTPSTAILVALAIEVVIGGLVLTTFERPRARHCPRSTSGQVT